MTVGAKAPAVDLPNLVLVVPVYNESEVLSELLRRLAALFNEHAQLARWSVILVDDGSRDNSAAQILEKCQSDPRFRLIELSRNFGFQAALLAGLRQAEILNADAVVTLDADLQDPPELIPQLVDTWKKDSCNIVLARRRSRQDGGLRGLCFKFFHAVFSHIVDAEIDQNTGTFCLLDRETLWAFNQLPESHRFFPGLRAWIGFKRSEVLYDRQKRAAGVPSQSFVKLCRYAFDAVFSFSRLPLRLLLLVGFLMAGTSFAIGMVFVFRRLLGVEVTPTGFTTLETVTSFLGGIQLIGIGITGEYLGRVYTEVKHRPHYLIRNAIGLDKNVTHQSIRVDLK